VGDLPALPKELSGALANNCPCGKGHAHEWTNDRWYAAQGNGVSSAAAFSEAGPDNAARLKAARWHDNNTCPCGAWLGSLGLEPTPELYIDHLVECFRQVRRALRDDGCVWLNLGDSYAGSGKGPSNSMQSEASQIGPSAIRAKSKFECEDCGIVLPLSALTSGCPNCGQTMTPLGDKSDSNSGKHPTGYKPKDLMMMPFRVAMALQADGWWLRSVIPWLKRNSMPESVTDRPSTSVEYVFLLAKAKTYFWDADAVRVSSPTSMQERAHLGKRPVSERHVAMQEAGIHGTSDTLRVYDRESRNRRNSDWFFESWQGLLLDEDDAPLALVVNPQPFSGAHFATFPPKLVEPMVKASTSEKGQCPECGAPWVRMTTTEYVKSPAHGAGSQMRNRAETTDVNGWAGMPRVARRDTTTGWQPSCAHADLAPVPQTILDPFSGAGTAAMVADRLGRNAIGCELSDEYGEMATDRLVGDSPMFTDVEGGASRMSSEALTDKQGALGKRTYTGFNARWDAREKDA
jgi:DNA modification methylase